MAKKTKVARKFSFIVPYILMVLLGMIIAIVSGRFWTSPANPLGPVTKNSVAIYKSIVAPQSLIDFIYETFQDQCGEFTTNIEIVGVDQKNGYALLSKGCATSSSSNRLVKYSDDKWHIVDDAFLFHPLQTNAFPRCDKLQELSINTTVFDSCAEINYQSETDLYTVRSIR